MNELSNTLSEILAQNIAKDFTSVSYAIMKDGKLIAADALGKTGGENPRPATLDDTYNVASISKIYCALAVMKLCELKKADLDTPICKYLPRFTMLDDRYTQITLRHCLNHTSGLPGTQWKGFSVSQVGDNHYYDETYANMSNCVLKAAPGEYSVYCNDGFTMAEMVVAEMSGMAYSAFCKKYITEPLGATSTALSEQLPTGHTLVIEGKKPPEMLMIQGGAGYTTSMSDLCKMGNIFLSDSGLFEPSSLKEMGKMQGASFFPDDVRSLNFGLGWDSVNFCDIDYDLGEGVLQKGGNSFQFTSQFFVIPKYNVVCAISETHDCKLDVSEHMLRLLAVALLSQGINIYKRHKVIPQDMIDKYTGKYAVPSGLGTVHMYGNILNITQENMRKERTPWHKLYKFDGEKFVGDNECEFTFASHDDNTYLMFSQRGKLAPMAEKLKNLPEVSETWKVRMGKKYIVVNTTVSDLVIHEMMAGFSLHKLDGFTGIMVACFGTRDDGMVYSDFENVFTSKNDNIGLPVLNTPANGSRDAFTPVFKIENDVEYCYGASYLYKDVAALDTYKDGAVTFSNDGTNTVYKIDGELKELPKLKDGRRIMIMGEKFEVVFDTLYNDVYKPLKCGYISFI